MPIKYPGGKPPPNGEFLKVGGFGPGINAPQSVDYTDHLDGPSVKAPLTKGLMSVLKTYKGKEIPDTLKEIELPAPVKPALIIAQELAHVTVQGSQTINTGNFNGVKIQVSLTLPCHISELDKTYEFITEWVSDKIETAIAQATKGT